MRAKEVIPALAAVTGFPEASLKVADRALADANLRSKGRGQKPPSLSRKDLLRLVLAVMGAPVLSRAHEYVTDAERFTLIPHGIVAKRGSDATLPQCIGLSSDELGDMSLIDVLERVVAHLTLLNPEPDEARTGARWGAPLWLKVEISGPILLEILGDDFAGEIQFSGAVSMHPGDMKRYSVISSETLLWIGWNSKIEATT